MSKISHPDSESQVTLSHTLRTSKNLLPFLRPHFGAILGACVWLILMASFTLIEPRILGWIVDWGLLPKSTSNLIYLTLSFAVVQVARALCQAAQSRAFARVGQRVMLDLRGAAWSRMMDLSMPSYLSQPVGKLVTRVTNDSATLSEMFSEGMVSVVGNVLVCLGTLAGLLWLDWRLSLISLGAFPVLVVFAIFFSRQLNLAYRSARARLSELNAGLSETLQGMKEVFLVGRESFQQKRFDDLNEAYTVSQFASTKVFAVFQPTITICTGLSMGLAIYYGGSRVAAGNLAVGSLVAFLAYILGLYQPVREIADKWNLFLSGMSAGERILEILTWEPEEKASEAEGSVLSAKSSRTHLEPRMVPFGGRIQFENVWFAYQDQNWVLRDVSFDIQPGQLIGLVGPSGAGKTTLIQLLLRFYDPQKGRILVDGRDLSQVSREWIRARIGFVQQDLFLFSGTVADNLALWDDQALDSSVAKDIKDWVKQLADSGRLRFLQDGLLTPLAERGHNLSLGERQILAFARAGLKRPDLWILDEATASVDSTTEAELTRLLERTCRGKTTLVVAHRLATIQKADQIFVFGKGALVESGTHTSLIAKAGLYQRLWRAEEATVWHQVEGRASEPMGKTSEFVE